MVNNCVGTSGQSATDRRETQRERERARRHPVRLTIDNCCQAPANAFSRSSSYVVDGFWPPARGSKLYIPFPREQLLYIIMIFMIPPVNVRSRHCNLAVILTPSRQSVVSFTTMTKGVKMVITQCNPTKLTTKFHRAMHRA